MKHDTWNCNLRRPLGICAYYDVFALTTLCFGQEACAFSKVKLSQGDAIDGIEYV